MHLEKLYDIIINYAKKLRKRFPDEDFEVHWQTLQDIIDKNNEIKFSKWYDDVLPNGAIYAGITEKVLDLPEKNINGRGEESIIEQNHYLIDVFRTPLQKKPTLNNLLHIGYSYGLMSAKLTKKAFPDGIVNVLKHLKWYQIINFISTPDFKTLETHISDELIKEIDVVCKKHLKHLALSRIIKAKDSDESQSESDSS